MNQLFNDALIIMVTGMTVVFAFLSIMIGAMRLLRVCFAEQPGAADEPTKQPVVTSDDINQNVAIAAALHHYRKRHQPHASK